MHVGHNTFLIKFINISLEDDNLFLIHDFTLMCSIKEPISCLTGRAPCTSHRIADKQYAIHLLTYFIIMNCKARQIEKVFLKKVFLKISGNSHENTCVGLSYFYEKLIFLLILRNF